MKARCIQSFKNIIISGSVKSQKPYKLRVDTGGKICKKNLQPITIIGGMILVK